MLRIDDIHASGVIGTRKILEKVTRYLLSYWLNLTYFRNCDMIILYDSIDICRSLIKKHGIHSIAFPSISTGKFSYPKKEACHIAVKTVKEWLKENCDYRMKIVFSCVDPIGTYARFSLG